MLSQFKYCVLSAVWKPSYDRFLLSDDRYQPTVLEQIEEAGKVAGLSGIELIHPQQVHLENITEIQAALQKAQLQVPAVFVSVSSKRKYRGGSLTADDPTTRQEAIDTVKNGMDIADALGTDMAVVWLGRDGYDYPFQIDYQQSWQRLVAAFQEIGAHRPEIKVAINYKIKEPRRWLLVSTAAKTMLLLDEVGLDNLGVLLDFGHSLLAYENPAESIALLARHGRLFHTHINDTTRLWDDNMVIGSVHFLEILEMLYWLEKVGYQGWLSFDPHPILEDATRTVEESLHYVQGMINVLGRIGSPAIEAAIASRQVTEMMRLVRNELFNA